MGQQWLIKAHIKPFLPLNQQLNGYHFERSMIGRASILSAHLVNHPDYWGRWHYRVLHDWERWKFLPHWGVLIALAIGERHLMKSSVKEIFMKTGTIHLLAISGLHVGLAYRF